jgi:disulfide bond formation protein DsbB
MTDFNQDGFDDLAIGALTEGLGDFFLAGVVSVLHGNPGGLTSAGNQFWHQDSAGVLGVVENDLFGRAVAGGDFNGDGFDDLAIGADSESIGAVRAAGSVNVLRGSAGGLTASGDQLWHQNSAGILDTAERDDLLGYSARAGDFNGDGFGDLAIGALGENIGSVDFAGATSILYGSARGLTAAGNQFWHQNSAGILDVAEQDDRFGLVIAAGDFNDDGIDDLAIGVPEEGIGTLTGAGAINVLRGTPGGLTATGNQFWHQDSPGLLGRAEANDSFGYALVAGDFNGDGADDLATGIVGESVGTVNGAGAVAVLRGSGNGLTAQGNQLWHQNSQGVLGIVEANDGFGFALAAGDFNNDGFDDLAIHVRQESVGEVVNAGSINVLYGSAGGLSAAGDQLWHQNSAGILDVAEAGDIFGESLSVGDFNGDDFDDLAVGIESEDIGSVGEAGATSILYGSAGGLTATGNQFWHQNSPGILDSSEQFDQFGSALVSGLLLFAAVARRLPFKHPAESTVAAANRSSAAVGLSRSGRLTS